jgi:hypothetical protein
MTESNLSNGQVIRKENMQSLGDALKLLVQSLGIESQVEQYKIFDVWNDVVGQQVAKVAQPERWPERRAVREQ